jgi:hypothetical protein
VLLRAEARWYSTRRCGRDRFLRNCFFGSVDLRSMLGVATCQGTVVFDQTGWLGCSAHVDCFVAMREIGDGSCHSVGFWSCLSVSASLASL